MKKGKENNHTIIINGDHIKFKYNVTGVEAAEILKFLFKIIERNKYKKSNP